MSKTFPYQLHLDQIARGKLRQPGNVNRRAIEAITEAFLENHQELEESEIKQAGVNTEQSLSDPTIQDYLESDTPLNSDRVSIFQAGSSQPVRHPAMPESSYEFRDPTDYDWIDVS